MNKKGYINIQGWMIREDLSLAESTVWAVIYGFSQNGGGEYYGSLSYIQQALRISKNTVVRILKKLIEKGCIKKTSQSHYIAFNIDVPETGICQKLVYPKLVLTVPETGTLAVPETEHNNYNTNNKDNNNSERVSHRKLTPFQLFVEELKPLNPIAYTKWFSNTTQRKNIELLMKEFPIGKVKELVRFIKLNQGKQFFPSITTPTQLVDKLPQVEKFYKSNGYKKPVTQTVGL